MFDNNDFLHLLFVQLWQVSIVIVIAIILVKLVARNRPHLAYMIWLVVLIKCITPPVFSSPSSLFSQLQPPTETTQSGGNELVTYDTGSTG